MNLSERAAVEALTAAASEKHYKRQEKGGEKNPLRIAVDDGVLNPVEGSMPS